jgi:hypothetical protein
VEVYDHDLDQLGDLSDHSPEVLSPGGPGDRQALMRLEAEVVSVHLADDSFEVLGGLEGCAET